MKTALVVLLVFAAVVVLLQRHRAAEPPPAEDNPYEGLRGLALKVSPSDLGLTVGPDEVWGVLMDLPVSSATATLVAFADGAVSIYLSSGGGFIGGGARQTVRSTAEGFIEAAQAASGMFTTATACPLPPAGRVGFCVRVGSGVRTADAGEQELQSGRHPLSPVYAAGQAVITAYRETEQ